MIISHYLKKIWGKSKSNKMFGWMKHIFCLSCVLLRLFLLDLLNSKCKFTEVKRQSLVYIHNKNRGECMIISDIITCAVLDIINISFFLLKNKLLSKAGKMNARLNHHSDIIMLIWLAAASDVWPVADPACPPLSAPALCWESAASAPAHELLGARHNQSEASSEEAEDQLHKLGGNVNFKSQAWISGRWKMSI